MIRHKFFFQAGKQILNTCIDIMDPRIGPTILAIQRPTLLIRADGRSPELLRSENGFLPRTSPEHVKSIRTSHVQNYQNSNQNPFAWGACSSLKDLKVFLENNPSHTKGTWIHKFYGQASSLLELKIKVGLEISGYDDEREEVFMEHIPFDRFIASTSPDYREKFITGGLVPNAMADYNPDLPKTMRMEDIHTEKDVLRWLLIHDAQQTFETMCKALYTGAERSALTHRLKDSKLIDTVLDTIRSGERPAP